MLSDLGPDAAGLKEVAAAAGVSHGLVTHYFGTFEALVAEVLDRAAHNTREHMIKRLVAMTNQNLEAALDVFFEVMSAPQHGRLVAWSLLSGRSSANDFLAAEVQGPRRVADAIEGRLRQLHPNANIQREEIDRLMALVLMTGLSMSFGSNAAWGALGRNQDAADHRHFRDWLAELVRGRVRDSMGIAAEGGSAEGSAATERTSD